MANKRTRVLNNDEFEKIISTIRQGFVHPSGDRYKPNERVATCLLVECNLGIRIGDVCRLRLSDILKSALNMQKLKKECIPCYSLLHFMAVSGCRRHW